MTLRSRRLAIGALIGVLIASGTAAFPRSTPVVDAQPLSVVELFTSQGCSSCPPADDNVRALTDRPDILVLSFGVTYWDQLGWKDTFAQPAFTARQVAYAHALRHAGPFTPQVVVDGRADVVGARPGEIEQLIGRTRLVGGPSVAIRGGVVALSAAPAVGQPADVWLIRYDPRLIEVPIRAGENDGRTLPHKNVVRTLVRLGDWSGRAVQFRLAPPPKGLSTAVLVQAADAGPILAAAKG
jgi:hypothetical protein